MKTNQAAHNPQETSQQAIINREDETKSDKGTEV
jgi:hypothetical protein